jgi:peptidoglycan/LPS O-acetylase OafA/YrhL
MEYRREIDGLRALAVVPVVLFHAGFQAFSGGYVGVDIFFVISGYLITSIILTELSAGQFSLINFYERRARRILPALYFVMLVCLPFAWLWLLPTDLLDFSKSLIAVSTFSSNILFWRSSGYFESASELKPLLHTWSLAVEEQYYLFFPVLLMLSWRLGIRTIVFSLITMTVASLCYAQLKVSANPSFAFFLLLTRGWEILIGALIAFALPLYQKRGSFNLWLGQLLSLVGLGLIIFSILSFNKNTPSPSAYTLLPTLGAALIIIFSSSKNFVGICLSSKPMVGLGLISYSSYLWHQPLLAFARHRSIEQMPSEILFSLICFLTFVIGYLSWRYVEKPFRNRNYITRFNLLLACGFFSLFFVIIGYVGYAQKGFASRLPESAQLKDYNMPKIDNGWCFYSVDSISDLILGSNGLNCHLGAQTSKWKGVLFGDSFAAHYEPLWKSASIDADLDINSITTNWCFPTARGESTGPEGSRSFSQCKFNREYILNNFKKYDFVILGGDWGDVLSKKKMDGVFEFIEKIAADVKVVVIMPSPKIFDHDVMRAYKKSIWWGNDFDVSKISAESDKVALGANKMLEIFSLKHKNIVYVDRDSLFQVSGKSSDLTSEGVPFSLDGGHISIYGAKQSAINFLASKNYETFRAFLK